MSSLVFLNIDTDLSLGNGHQAVKILIRIKQTEKRRDYQHTNLRRL